MCIPCNQIRHGHHVPRFVSVEQRCAIIKQHTEVVILHGWSQSFTSMLWYCSTTVIGHLALLGLVANTARFNKTLHLHETLGFKYIKWIIGNTYNFLFCYGYKSAEQKPFLQEQVRDTKLMVWLDFSFITRLLGIYICS